MIRSNKLKVFIFAAAGLSGGLIFSVAAGAPQASPPVAKPFLRPYHAYVVNGAVTLQPADGKPVSVAKSKAVRIHSGDHVVMGDSSVVLVSLGGEMQTWEGKFDHVIGRDAAGNLVERELTRAGHPRGDFVFITPKSGAAVDLKTFAVAWTPEFLGHTTLSLYAIGAAKPIWVQKNVDSHSENVDAMAVRNAIKRQMARGKDQTFVIVLAGQHQVAHAAWFSVR